MGLFSAGILSAFLLAQQHLRMASDARILPGVLELQGSPVVTGVTHLPTACRLHCKAVHLRRYLQVHNDSCLASATCKMIQTSLRDCDAFKQHPVSLMRIQRMVFWQHCVDVITGQALWPCNIC